MDDEIIPKQTLPGPLPSGIRVQYAEGFGAVTEETVKQILKKVRKRAYKHLYLTLDPYGESTFLEMCSENGWVSLSIGEEVYRDKRVTWTVYQSYDRRYSDSDEAAPIRQGQDIILKKYTIQDIEAVLQCIEWFIRTGTPYPGIDWVKHG